MLYTRDRVETTSKVWMGLTAGCAVCHDHKFDPLSQKEFYELAAFFNNTTQSADGRQHQGHAADRDGAAAMQIATRWDEAREGDSGRRSSWSTIAAARRGPSSTRGSRRPSRRMWRPRFPTSDLELFAPLDDGGETIRYELRGKQAERRRCRRPSNGGRAESARKAAYLNQGAVLDVRRRRRLRREPAVLVCRLGQAAGERRLRRDPGPDG